MTTLVLILVLISAIAACLGVAGKPWSPLATAGAIVLLCICFAAERLAH